jgi:hypothetical protein
MAKKKALKTNGNVGNEREIEQEYFPMIEKGEDIADVLMSIMKLVAIDWEGIGAMAFGMAKALAALKETARRVDMSVDDLHEYLLSYYEKDIAKFLDEHGM